MIIEKNEFENLMKEIQNLSIKLKQSEIERDYISATSLINKLENLIKNFILINNPGEERKKWLNILCSSYCSKKIEYNYFKFASEKSSLLKKKMAEKYLGKRRLNSQEDIHGLQQNNITNISEYEFVQSSSNVSGIVKDILESCKSLLKYYEIQIASSNRTLKNLKQVQSYESFYVYDYQNTTVNFSPYSQSIEKYIEEIKKIQTECESVLNSDVNLDFNKVKLLEKEINIIKEEFQKLYPKYQNLKDILEKNNLVKAKSKK
jgi:hypothetical protein